MIDEKIDLSVLDSKDVRRQLTVSAGEAHSSSKKVVSTPNSTQGERVTIQAESLRIVPSRAEVVESRVSADDVAAFILEQQGEMTAMKLQKLVYYSQAWSLVWDDEPLFYEPIEAWANGPVIRSLYHQHKGRFKVTNWQGDPRKLSDNQRETILKVLEFYGGMSSQVLSELSHSEEPWLKARAGMAIGDRGSRVIPLGDMAEYYSSL